MLLDVTNARYSSNPSREDLDFDCTDHIDTREYALNKLKAIEVFQFPQLPSEMQIEVMQHLDIPDLIALMLTNKEWSAILSDPQTCKRIGAINTWQAKADKINCLIAKDSLPIDNQLIAFIKDLKNQARLNIKLPNEIDDFLEKVRRPFNIEEVIHIQKCLRAYFMLKSKEELFKTLNPGIFLPSLDTKSCSSEALITLGQEDEAWTVGEKGNLLQVTVLNLQRKYLTLIPGSFFEFVPNLIKLDLSENKLSTLPSDFTKLNNLSELILDFDKFNTLSNIIIKLNNLQKLTLNKSRDVRPDVNEVSKEIGNFIQLTSLDLSDNNIVLLPDEIGNLTNLTELNVKSSNLRRLPNTIGNLHNLMKLDLNTNNIDLLPDEIGNLVNLTELDVSNNKLNNLPNTIGNLTNLTALKVSSNKLNNLPNTIGNLTNLNILIADRNNLEVLPNSMGNLGQLTILSLSNNKLKSIPKSFVNLGRLQMLWLDSNSLTSIPLGIGDIRALARFNLSNNQLALIPEEIDQLKKNASSFDISGNIEPSLLSKTVYSMKKNALGGFVGTLAITSIAFVCHSLVGSVLFPNY